MLFGGIKRSLRKVMEAAKAKKQASSPNKSVPAGIGKLAGSLKSAAKSSPTETTKTSGGMGNAVKAAVSGATGLLGAKKSEDDKKKAIFDAIRRKKVFRFKDGGSASKKATTKKTVSKGRGMGAATRGGGACARSPRKMAKGGMC